MTKPANLGELVLAEILVGSGRWDGSWALLRLCITYEESQEGLTKLWSGSFQQPRRLFFTVLILEGQDVGIIGKLLRVSGSFLFNINTVFGIQSILQSILHLDLLQTKSHYITLLFFIFLLNLFFEDNCLYQTTRAMSKLFESCILRIALATESGIDLYFIHIWEYQGLENSFWESFKYLLKRKHKKTYLCLKRII